MMAVNVRLTDRRWWYRDLQMVMLTVAWVNLYQWMLGLNVPHSTDAAVTLVLAVTIMETLDRLSRGVE